VSHFQGALPRILIKACEHSGVLPNGRADPLLIARWPSSCSVVQTLCQLRPLAAGAEGVPTLSAWKLIRVMPANAGVLVLGPLTRLARRVIGVSVLNSTFIPVTCRRLGLEFYESAFW
jgi:hypothetical protein